MCQAGNPLTFFFIHAKFENACCDFFFPAGATTIEPVCSFYKHIPNLLDKTPRELHYITKKYNLLDLISTDACLMFKIIH